MHAGQLAMYIYSYKPCMHWVRGLHEFMLATIEATINTYSYGFI